MISGMVLSFLEGWIFCFGLATPLLKMLRGAHVLALHHSPLTSGAVCSRTPPTGLAPGLLAAAARGWRAVRREHTQRTIRNHPLQEKNSFFLNFFTRNMGDDFRIAHNML
ncbi:MAG: hypothetical protein MJ058_06275 [Akkermansia sp.]|nr:hypothetical protein [Akkermansia sp.]